MDIELNTMLVALMFVTILSMGIGNVLVTLADVFNHATRSRRSRVHVAWVVLLLLLFERRLQQVEELGDMRMHRDQVVDLLLEQGDVQPQFPAPMVDAIPLQGPLDIAIARQQLLLGRGLGHATRQCISLGHVLEPKMIVEMQVQQGSVHVQQDRIDVVPVEHLVSHPATIRGFLYD